MADKKFVSKLPMVVLLLILVTAQLVDAVGSIGGRRAEITLNRDGGYDFLIAIHEDVKEDFMMLDKLQGLIQGASEAMLTATDGRMFFHNVTILVPSNWTEKPTWKPAQGESFSRARFLIESGLDSYLEPIYTLQPGGCGEEGDFVHITPDYIKSFRELPYPFQDEDVYEKYDFDPYDSGDFSFVENLLSSYEYIPGLILNLVAQDQRQDLYPNDATRGDVFQHTLWSFLMKQIMGVRMSKEVGDRYEVWRIEKQKDSFDTVLSRRLIHLHNNKVGRELSLTFDIGDIVKVIFKLAKDASSIVGRI